MRCGVNEMWILKHSKEWLEYLKSKAISIKTFHLPRLKTTIPHEQISFKWPNKKYFYVFKWFTEIQVCSRKVQHCIFVKDESDYPNKYSDTAII